MKLPARALVALVCCGAAPLAYADDAGLLRCRAVVDPGGRLACYDSLAVGAAQGPTAPSAGMTQGAAAAAPRLQNEFGLQGTPASEIKSIDSHINGRFTGWGPAQLITLANGQVWRIADGSSAYFEANSPKVRVERGMFAAFYMVIAGINQSPRVQRVK